MEQGHGSGWIKLHRSCLDHWLYTEYRPLTRREAWETILLTVNYQPSKALIKGQIYDCQPGQSLLSLDSWAKKFVWSIQQVRTFFKLLENDGMISTEGLQYTTRLTVCNWATYQENATDQQQTNNNPKSCKNCIFDSESVKSCKKTNNQNSKEITRLKDCISVNYKYHQQTENIQNNTPITDGQQTDNKPITTIKEREEREEGKEGYKKRFLSEINLSDFPSLKDDYIKAAKAFQDLFRKNLLEAGASSSNVDKAKGTWIDDIRLIIETDKYSINDLRTVFDFLQTNSFWKKNILSTSKLREKMDKLIMEVSSSRKENQKKSKEATSWTELAEIVANAFSIQENEQ